MTLTDWWTIVGLGAGFVLLTIAGLIQDKRDGKKAIQQAQDIQRLRHVGPQGYGRSWAGVTSTGAHR